MHNIITIFGVGGALETCRTKPFGWINGYGLDPKKLKQVDKKINSDSTNNNFNNFKS